MPSLAQHTQKIRGATSGPEAKAAVKRQIHNLEILKANFEKNGAAQIKAYQEAQKQAPEA